MNILVLNGSPRKKGNTAAMCRAFCEAAEKAHQVKLFSVCDMNIAGCRACEYCHTRGNGNCIQKDDMQQIYPYLAEADMLVMASPIYYHSYSGQLQCVLNRIYAPDKPKKLKKTALFLAAGSPGTFDGAVFAYHGNFTGYLKTEDMGIFTVSEQEKNLEQVLAEIREMAVKL